MLLVDPRIGSADLLQPLIRLGVPAQLQMLDSADCAFIGRGEQGADVHIGVELKETRDLVKCLWDRRYARKQLPKLLSTYDRAWLLTEGIWRTGSSGALETYTRGSWANISSGARAVMASEFHKKLITLTVRGGVYYQHCGTRAETLRWLAVLYHWWTDKNLDEHKSHLGFHQQDLDRALLETPSTCRLIAKELPGIGWEKSRAVEEHFRGSTRAMVCATPAEWAAIPGIGRTIAARIDRELAGPAEAATVAATTAAA